MCTAPTRGHAFAGFGTSFHYLYLYFCFYFFLVIPHVSFRFVLGSILEIILVRSTLGAGGGRGNVIEKRCEHWHRTKWVLRRYDRERVSRTGDQDEGKGGGKPPPWEIGRKKKGRKEERKKGRKEDLKI